MTARPRSSAVVSCVIGGRLFVGAKFRALVQIDCAVRPRSGDPEDASTFAGISAALPRNGDVSSRLMGGTIRVFFSANGAYLVIIRGVSEPSR
uniref:Plasmid stabilization protein n=1 Tax=Steinernema glaseri TaxID=37863 RepID=A0A1I7YJ19_9BILA